MGAAFIPLMVLLFLIPAKTHSQIVTNSGDSNYTAGSPFKSDIDGLVANLTSSSAAYFSTSSAGATYGLAQCRPDATPAQCAACHNDSAASIAARCPLAKSAAVRFDYCVLRYADQPVLSQPAGGNTVIVYNTMNAPDPAAFNTQVRRLMRDVTAAAVAAKLRFAVVIRNHTEFDYLYGLAWCTQDLSPDDCGMCLDGVVSSLPYGKVGAHMVTVNCSVGFETHRWFSFSAVPPPPSSPDPNPPATPPPSSPDPDPPVNNDVAVDDDEFRSSESFLFDLGTLKAATNNFSDANKLGEGKGKDVVQSRQRWSH